MPVSPEIVQAAARAAGIVVLVSLAYLRSEWCYRERSTSWARWADCMVRLSSTWKNCSQR